MFKHAIDALNVSPLGAVPVIHVLMMTPAMMIMGYGVVRVTASLCSELRTALFSRVAQRALRTIANELFVNLHAQDLK